LPSSESFEMTNLLDEILTIARAGAGLEPPPDIIDICCDTALVATRLDAFLRVINDDLDDGRLREPDIMRVRLPELRELRDRLTAIVGQAETLAGEK
jgi:signal transduction histidine kinase